MSRKPSTKTTVTYPGYVPDSELEQVVIMDVSKDGTTGKTSINSIYSPTMYPPLIITSNNVSRTLDVVFVSTEAEEKERMMHYLLASTRAVQEPISPKTK